MPDSHAKIVVIGGEARIVGPGRLKVRLDGVPVQADYWVLWVDEGYRTAAVGVPSGRASPPSLRIRQIWTAMPAAARIGRKMT